MSYKAIYTALKVKNTRDVLIEKIDNGFKTNVGFKPDPEKDQRHKAFLLDWKNKTKDEQKDFARELMEDEGFFQGYSYAYNKKEELKQKIAETPGNIKNKVSEGIKKVFENG